MMSESLTPETMLPLEAEERSSKWPTVIGVISLIYGVGGMLCGLSYSAFTLFMEALMRMGGMTVNPPPIIKVLALTSGAILFALGILLVTGAVKLLRRRRSGVKLLKIWVVLRVVMLVIGLAQTILTAPALIDFSRMMAEATNERLREAGEKEQPIPTDDQLWRDMIRNTAIMSAVLVVYPIFLGFYLSRRQITAEVEQWR